MSVVSDILAVIETRMAATETAAGVIRPIRHTDPAIADRVVVITHQDIEVEPELNHVGNPPAMAFVLPVVCAAIVNPSEDDNDPIDVLVADFHSAMVKAITENNSANWYTFGDNSINAEIGPPIDYKPGDSSAHGSQFITRITYRISETDPDTARG